MSSPESQMVMVIPPEDIRRGHEQLGRGTYGTVYRARWQGTDVAVKLFDAQRDVPSLQKEMLLLARCQHPNIVRLFGVWLGQADTERPSSAGSGPDYACPYYVMELADSGTVADIVHNRPTVHYTIGLAFSWFLQCASAVAYLHAHQPRPIIHRDLKSMNLLLFDSGRVLKVCDFGTVREQSTDMTSSKGTVAWMAPEILTNSRYSPSVDVYSLGMVMWEVLARSRPFKDMNSYSIMFHIHAGQRPPPFRDCPETLRSLLAACLNQDPARRPPIANLVELLELVALRLPGFADGLIEPEPATSLADGAAASDVVAAGLQGLQPGFSGDGGPADDLLDIDVEVTEDPPPPPILMPSASSAAAGAAGAPASSGMSLRPLPKPRSRSGSKSPTPPSLQQQQQQQHQIPLQVTNEPHLMPSLATPQDGSDQLELMRVIWEELPVDMLPPQALPGNSESEMIFFEHQRLLNDYTNEQMTLMRLTQEQKDLEQQLLQLVSREQLRELLDLKQRLDELRRSQGAQTQRSLSALELNHRS